MFIMAKKVKRLYRAKALPEPVTTVAVFEKTSEGYTGFLSESPNIRAEGSTLDEARLNLQAEIFLMFDTHCSLTEILPDEQEHFGSLVQDCKA
jgi:predicted RNase H-like HicB family nuclease